MIYDDDENFDGPQPPPTLEEANLIIEMLGVEPLMDRLEQVVLENLNSSPLDYLGIDSLNRANHDRRTARGSH